MFAFSHGTSAPEVMPGLEDPPARCWPRCRRRGLRLRRAGAARVARPRALPLAGLRRGGQGHRDRSRGGVPHQERLICSVERAPSSGADGVVALLPFAPDNEPEVISLTAELGEACARAGMPFVAEAEYPNAYYGEADYAQRVGAALPQAERPPVRGVRCRHREEQLAGIGRELRRDRGLRAGAGGRGRRVAASPTSTC